MATITLYHYTSASGAKCIQRSKRINESRPKSGGGDDARHGRGVYLTSIAPNETTKLKLMLNNYDGTPDTMLKRVIAENTRKIEKVVVVELPAYLVKRVESERDIYVVKGDIDLTNFTYDIRDGPQIAF
ncbi:uncharacterized protein LOC135494886 [Lineus longissimus]|uniref:uncharacterized protein LOC135494886 n=1 Tax=Lineus longissimus TaxID=88925 RepID=UPI002B4E0819